MNFCNDFFFSEDKAIGTDFHIFFSFLDLLYVPHVA